MTNEELLKDVIRENEILKKRNEQLARENRLLKERLGYRRAVDAKYSQADAEVFLIVKMNHMR